MIGEGVSAVKADTGNLPLLNLLVAAEKFATDAQPSFGGRYSTALIVTSGCQFAAEDPQQTYFRSRSYRTFTMGKDQNA